MLFRKHTKEKNMKLEKTVRATLAVARFGLPESLSHFSNPGRVTLQTEVHAVLEAPPAANQAE